MATEYCDAWTYNEIYGHYPPTDGSHDPALGDPEQALSTAGVKAEVTSKVVTAPEQPAPEASQVAETK